METEDPLPPLVAALTPSPIPHFDIHHILTKKEVKHFLIHTGTALICIDVFSLTFLGSWHVCAIVFSTCGKLGAGMHAVVVWAELHKV